MLPFRSGLQFLLKGQLLSIWSFPCMLLVASLLLLLMFFLCVWSLLLWLVCVLACFSLGLSCMGLFVPLALDWLFLFHVGEVSTIISSKIFSYPFFFSSSFGTPIIQMLLHLILSQGLRLYSVLFILFTLYCSSEVVSTILSSSSLIRSSASDILLLIPSRVFLISVIVLFVSLSIFSLILLCLC